MITGMRILIFNWYADLPYEHFCNIVDTPPAGNSTDSHWLAEMFDWNNLSPLKVCGMEFLVLTLLYIFVDTT